MCIHCSMLRPAEACMMAASIRTAHKPNRAWYLEAMVCESSCMCTGDYRGRNNVCQTSNCSCLTNPDLLCNLWALKDLESYIETGNFDVLQNGRCSSGN